MPKQKTTDELAITAIRHAELKLDLAREKHALLQALTTMDNTVNVALYVRQLGEAIEQAKQLLHKLRALQGHLCEGM